MLIPRASRPRAAAAIAGLLAVAVLAGGAGIAAAGGGSSKADAVSVPDKRATDKPHAPTPASRRACSRRHSARSTRSSPTGRSTRARRTPCNRGSRRAPSIRRRSLLPACSTRTRCNGSTTCSVPSSCRTQAREPGTGRPDARHPAGRQPAPGRLYHARANRGGMVADQRGLPDLPFGQQMRQDWESHARPGAGCVGAYRPR